MKDLLLRLTALSLALAVVSCSAIEKGRNAKVEGNPFSTRAAAEDVEKKTAEGESADGESAQANAEAASAEETALLEKAEPTAEQQEAARELLGRSDATGEAIPEPEPVSTSPDAVAEPTSRKAPPGGLRLGGIAPTEDSAAEGVAPGANSVEQHGLRSPKLPNKLPMNIDGKLESDSATGS